VLCRSGERYRPISLGIPGSYNRYGSIDVDTPSANTEAVLSYFRDRLRDGGLVVNGRRDESIDDIEQLLWLFERNALTYLRHHRPRQVTTLDGELVVTTLIAQPVWDALTAGPDPDSDGGSPRAWFGRVCRDSPMAGTIYRGRISELATEIRRLYRVNEFLRHRGLAWAGTADPIQRYPTDYGGQFYGAVNRAFLAQARRDFADVVVLRAAFDQHETELGEVFQNDEEPPEPAAPDTAARRESSPPSSHIQRAIRISTNLRAMHADVG